MSIMWIHIVMLVNVYFILRKVFREKASEQKFL